MGTKRGYNIRMKENELNLTLPIFVLVSFMSICAIAACGIIIEAILEAL